MTLTLNLIKSKNPCEDGYEKLLASLNKTKADDEPVSINHILESNGIKDTLWVIFRCIEDREMDKRNMLADIVESVEWIYKKEYPDNRVVRDVIEALRDENVGKKELEKLGDEAFSAASAAAASASYAAYWATRAAYYTSIASDAASYAASASYAAYWAIRKEGKTIEEAEIAEKEERQKQKGIILKWFGDL